MRLVLAMVTAALLLGGCASPRSDIATRASRVAVAVVAGEELDLVRIGFLVFGNERAKAEPPGTMLADAIYEEVSGELAREEKFEIRRLDVPLNRMKDVRASIRSAFGGFDGNELKAMPAELVQLAASCQCDALLVALGGIGVEDMVDSNQRFGPLAWVTGRGIGDKPSRTYVSVAIDFLLVDVAKMASGGVEYGRRLNRSLGGVAPIDASLWPIDMKRVDAAAWPVLVGGIRKATAGSARVPLYKLGLRPSCALRLASFDPTPAVDPLSTVPKDPPKLPPGVRAEQCE